MLIVASLPPTTPDTHTHTCAHVQTLAKRQIRNTHFEQIAVVVHHEQNHQVHLSFGESAAVDDGTRERPFHRHPVLDLTRELFRINRDQARMHARRLVRDARGSAHLFVQFDLLRLGCDGHESQEPAELLPATRVLQLQAQLQGLQSLLLLAVH